MALSTPGFRPGIVIPSYSASPASLSTATLATCHASGLQQRYLATGQAVGPGTAVAFPSPQTLPNSPDSFLASPTLTSLPTSSSHFPGHSIGAGHGLGHHIGHPIGHGLGTGHPMGAGHALGHPAMMSPTVNDFHRDAFEIHYGGGGGGGNSLKNGPCSLGSSGTLASYSFPQSPPTTPFHLHQQHHHLSQQHHHPFAESLDHLASRFEMFNGRPSLLPPPVCQEQKLFPGHVNPGFSFANQDIALQNGFHDNVIGVGGVTNVRCSTKACDSSEEELARRRTKNAEDENGPTTLSDFSSTSTKNFEDQNKTITTTVTDQPEESAAPRTATAAAVATAAASRQNRKKRVPYSKYQIAELEKEFFINSYARGKEDGSWPIISVLQRDR